MTLEQVLQMTGDDAKPYGSFWRLYKYLVVLSMSLSTTTCQIML